MERTKKGKREKTETKKEETKRKETKKIKGTKNKKKGKREQQLSSFQTLYYQQVPNFSHINTSVAWN